MHEEKSKVDVINQSSTTEDIKKVSAVDLSHFLLDPQKMFARESIAIKEVKMGRARMFGIFPSDGVRESLFVLERV